MDAAGATLKAGGESLVVTEVRNNGGNNLMVTIRVPYDQTQPQREWHDRQVSVQRRTSPSGQSPPVKRCTGPTKCPRGDGQGRA